MQDCHASASFLHLGEQRSIRLARVPTGDAASDVNSCSVATLLGSVGSAMARTKSERKAVIALKSFMLAGCYFLLLF